MPDEAGKAEGRIQDVLSKSEKSFKQGLLNLKDNKRPQARDDFDHSVEAFLLSGINVRTSSKLQKCYSELIETIYRIEIPSNQAPEVKGLATTCGWTLENEFNEIAVALQSPAAQQTDKNSQVASADTELPLAPQTGFLDQKFEASPLDVLAKLELNANEQNVDTPEAKASEQYIKVALSRGSLGFNFQFHANIQQYINYYQGRGRSTMETGLYRSGMFMRMARRIFREEGVPENVAWLGQVESTWKPTAHSWAAAAGLWQFIPGTGARYGLRQNAYIDERQSFERATRASAQYLKFLANRYNGNWELAMAAYNSGEGNVDRAVARAGSLNFWAAYPYLPRETKNYVPNILATILIANDPFRYGFGNVRPAAQLTYDQVRVPASTNLGLIAQASDTSVEFLRYLNPEFRQNVTPPEPYIVRVPAGKANQVVAVLKRVPANNRSTASVTSVAAGENWQAIANRTGVSVEQLQAMNNGMVNPQGGGKIVVPKSIKQTASVRASSPTAPVPTAGSVKIVKAKANDTVKTVAARYKVNAVELAKFNGLLPDSPLAAGREIKVPVR
ncbi:MAG TPA: transglycosylase SLT domain-containing protein [Pyrinomonadaceae bacterium]|nr:transglycosylase SLT domain-containing protein [Pyrinomonadaceae bacterium]